MVAFLLYWVGLAILSMPANPAKNLLASRVTHFKSAFGTTWKLFTPPHTYNIRLYYIVRNISSPFKADTLEVLENISLKKQQAAPFNQKESITDALVNNNVIGVLNAVWENREMPQVDSAGTADTIYIARVVAEKANNRNYQIYLASLHNYCRLVLKENNLNEAGKEVKIVIKEKLIKPFADIDNAGFVPKEIVVFATDYKPIN